jgi:hypothetical protein
MTLGMAVVAVWLVLVALYLLWQFGVGALSLPPEGTLDAVSGSGAGAAPPAGVLSPPTAAGREGIGCGRVAAASPRPGAAALHPLRMTAR